MDEVVNNMDNVLKMKPTEKQIDFAKTIAKKLGIQLPAEYTKEAYNKFISSNIDKFKKSKINTKSNYMNQTLKSKTLQKDKQRAAAIKSFKEKNKLE